MSGNILIIIILLLVVAIALTSYAIWYNIKSKKQKGFFKTSLDLFLMQLAKKFKNSKDIYFILNDRIYFSFVRGMVENVYSIMITPYKLFIFKYLDINVENDEENEIKFIQRFVKKIELNESLISFIYIKGNYIILNNKKLKLSNPKNFIKLLNLQNELSFNNKLDYSKIYKMLIRS